MNANEAAVAEAIETLSKLQGEGDPEKTHSKADKAILRLLKALGLRKVAQLYDSVEKWYA